MGGCETTPPDRTREPPSEPLPGNHNPAGSPTPPIIGHRLPASSSFVLARALTGAAAAGAPAGPTARAAARNRQLRGKPAKAVLTPNPATQQVTGPAHHALLTDDSPMGGKSGQLAVA